jgi:hypothetical protein
MVDTVWISVQQWKQGLSADNPTLPDSEEFDRASFQIGTRFVIVGKGTWGSFITNSKHNSEPEGAS